MGLFDVDPAATISTSILGVWENDQDHEFAGVRSTVRMELRWNYVRLTVRCVRDGKPPQYADGRFGAEIDETVVHVKDPPESVAGPTAVCAFRMQGGHWKPCIAADQGFCFTFEGHALTVPINLDNSPGKRNAYHKIAD